MLRLRLFGEPVLLDDDGTVRPLWRPQLALLAFVSLAPDQVASRSVLTGLLWPEHPESSARRSLRQTIFQVRRNLGEVISAPGDLVRLEPARIEVDVCRFEALHDAGRYAEAVDLHAGDFLEGFTLGSPAFDGWADRQRPRLGARAGAACSALVDAAAGRADWAEALHRAQQWAEREPFSERAASRMIALRAQMGDRAGALAEYETFRARLRDQLEVEPGPALERLVKRVQRSAAPSPETVAPTPALRSAPVPLHFVGRDAEHARLSHAWERARAGTRQWVFVTGEAGIGKTRLVHEFARWAELEGGTVLRGRSYEVERDVPYTTLAGILRGALHAPGLAALDEGALSELSRIVPRFASRFPGVERAAGTDLESGRMRLLEAVRLLFDNLAFEAPVLLVLDDLAWADTATLAAIHYVWRNLEAAPLLVLGTARSLESSLPEPTLQLIGTLLRESPGSVDQVVLEPWRAESIVRLAHELDGCELSDAEVTGLLETTGGNPFFVVEALRARREGSSATASATVRAVIAERLRRVSPAARDLLRAGAVLGRRFPFPFAAALASLPHEEAIEGLEQLLGRRLLQQVGYEYDFAHDLVRQTVYDDLSTERRRHLHRLAFERLEPTAGETTGLDRASSLALHAARAGLPGRARPWLLQAAEHACHVFAGAEAEQFLEQALETAVTDPERASVLEQLADVRFAQSRFAAAAVTYREAVRHRVTGSPERLRLRIKLLDASLRCGLIDLTTGSEAIERLAADAIAAGLGQDRDLLLALAAAYLRDGRTAVAEDHARRAVAAARAVADPRPLIRALLLHAQTVTLKGSGGSALPILAEAVRIAAEHDLHRERADAETDWATELSRLGEWDQAIATWRGVIERGTHSDEVGATAVAMTNLSDVLMRRGEWDDAAAYADRAEALARHFSFPHLTADVLVNRALSAWHRGLPEQTVEAAQPAMEHARAEGFRVALRNARCLRILGLLALDRLDDARSEAEQLPDEPTDHCTWSDDGELVAIARARLAVALDDRPGAIRVLKASLGEAPDPHARALLRLELADLLRTDDPGEAARVAELAAADATRLNARPLVERAAVQHRRLSAHRGS